MVNLKNITIHSEQTYTFMPPSVAHMIGYALNNNGISNWELHMAHSAKKKGIIPANIEIPKVPLHQNEPNGKYVLRNKEWVLVSNLDSKELTALFEDIISDDDISKQYLKSCGQENLDQY